MSENASHPVPAHDALLDRASRELKRRARLGLLVCLLLVGGIGGWSATAMIAGAVIAPGVVVVDSNSKKVQHPTGGIVGEIRPKIGDRVTAGDILVRLDETQVRASLGVIQSQLVQAAGRRARLEAERDNADAITFAKGFESESVEAREVAAGERRFFAARRASSKGQKEQHGERIRQLNEEIAGVKSQILSKDDEFELATKEFKRLEGLHEKQLVNETRMLAARRDIVRIEGEHGSLVAQIARSKAQISQIELQILQVDQDVRTESQKELRETEAKIAELMERKVAADDQLRRVDIRAPIDGVVHEMNVHTIGGVIQAGETLMLIVPSGELLAIEARISPIDIDQVAVGGSSLLRFTAFNQRTTPEVTGTVTHVAADLSKEPQTGASYFLVRIRLDESAKEKLAGLKIVPGMPVEGFIGTGERTALSYIVKPLVDNLARMFRER